MASNFWDRNAENWAAAIQTKAIASRSVTNDSIMDAIVKIHPQSLLDIGCGEGFISSQLEQRSKNAFYLGIDGSAALVEIAKRSHPAQAFQHITYEQIIHGQWKPEQKFDAILFNFSLLDMEISSLLAATSGFLNKGGRLFIQTLHPFFALDEYKDGMRVEDFKTMSTSFEGTMPWYGRTLQSWSWQFAASSLRIVEIIEPAGEQKPLSIIFVLEPASLLE